MGTSMLFDSKERLRSYGKIFLQCVVFLVGLIVGWQRDTGDMEKNVEFNGDVWLLAVVGLIFMHFLMINLFRLMSLYEFESVPFELRHFLFSIELAGLFALAGGTGILMQLFSKNITWDDGIFFVVMGGGFFASASYWRRRY